MKAHFYKLLPLLLTLCFGALWARGQTISINGPNPVCKSQSGTYTVVPLTSSYHYVWSVTGPGNIAGSPTGTSVNVVWAGSGSGVVSVTAYNAANASQGTANYSITSLPPPAPLITASSRVACQQLADSPKHGGEQQPPADPGILDDADGCVKVCENSTVIYTVTGGAGSSYTWTVTGASSYTPSGTTCNINWGAAGPGSVSVKETTGPAGCMGTKTICINIIEKPHAKFDSQIEPGKDFISVCLNDNVIFVDHSTGTAGSPILSWYWDFGDGGTFSASNGSPVQHQFTHPGFFTVKLIVKNACGCTDVYAMKVEVRPEEGVHIACPSVVCEGATATYKLEPSVPCDKYLWEAEGGTIIGYDPAQPFVTVQWDQVDATGFGYVSFDASPCHIPCPGNTGH